ncbi:MAG TPA: hypothetical protein PLM89_12785, partial [Anaerolineales bacterium]|nr:hypothetical protein [Anaerolineales bacterium]
QEKRIHTLPVVIGEKVSRYMVIGMMVFPYLIIFHLIGSKVFSPVLLVTLLALPSLRQVVPAFLKPKPAERPADFPEGQGGWPLYFAPLSFVYNRAFGSYFLLGLLADTLIRKFLM